VRASILGSEYPVFLGFSFDFPNYGINMVSMTVSRTLINVPIGEFTSNIILRPDIIDNQQFVSVSILPNHWIAFNESREQFLQNRCFNQSFFAVPLVTNMHDHSTGVRLRYTLIESNVEGPRATHPTNVVSQTHVAKLRVSRVSIISLPSELFDFIHGLIATLSAQFSDYELIIQRLPSIKISFLGIDSITAEIVLAPIDYTAWVDGGCRLFIEPSHDGSIFFNPFRLPGINTHITALDIGFCDSRE
jgi:hypothetical protein